MKRCLFLFLAVSVLSVTAAADGGGLSLSATSIHVTQWSISGPDMPTLPGVHNSTLLPGLYPIVNPNPLLFHGMILAPTPSPCLSPILLPVASPSAQLALLSLLGPTHVSLLGDNITFLAIQQNQISLP
jgi:hypothetical protein